MKDSVVRGCLLQLLYERRSEGSIPFGQGEQAVLPPGGISRRDWLRALVQLSEYHLIDWAPLEDQGGMGLLSGFAKINDFGVKVFEGDVAPPIQISMDEHQQMITDALEKVITAINQADVSEQEKNEAKTLLRRLLGSKAAVSVLGPGAQSLSPRSISRNKAESGRQRFVGSLSDSGIRRTRNGKSFGKYAQSVLTDDVNYRGSSDEAK